MSNQVQTAHVQQYSSTIYHKAQQMGSRLRGAVRNEKQVGKAAFYDQLGAATAVDIISRHADTVYSNTPHSRRMVTMVDKGYADMFDVQDKIRMLVDPTSPYVEAAVNALGRSIDDVIIAAASATAATGESGTGTASLGTGQKVAATTGTAGDYLNVEALLNAKRILDGNDVDPSIRRYCALDSVQLSKLLNDSRISSSDYNTIRALVNGEIDTYLGFKFIRTERLLAQSGSLKFAASTGLYDAAGAVDANGYTKVLCWAERGILLATGLEVNASVDKLPGKWNSQQIMATMSVGATRMEEEMVVEVLCVAA